MYCKVCGAQNPDNEAYCCICGHPLQVGQAEQVNQQTPQYQTEQTAEQAQAYQTEQPYQANQQAQAYQTEQSYQASQQEQAYQTEQSYQASQQEQWNQAGQQGQPYQQQAYQANQQEQWNQPNQQQGQWNQASQQQMNQQGQPYQQQPYQANPQGQMYQANQQMGNAVKKSSFPVVNLVLAIIGCVMMIASPYQAMGSISVWGYKYSFTILEANDNNPILQNFFLIVFLFASVIIILMHVIGKSKLSLIGCVISMLAVFIDYFFFYIIIEDYSMNATPGLGLIIATIGCILTWVAAFIKTK